MQDNQNSRRAQQVFIGVMALMGCGCTGYSLMNTHAWHHYQFAALFVVALVASRLKVKLPGLNGNMSVNLPFILIAQSQLSTGEALIIAGASTLTQCLPRSHEKLNLAQLLFNFSTMSIAVELGSVVFHGGQQWQNVSGSLLGGASALAFFVANTLPVAGIIALCQGARLLKTWSSIFHLSFPYYLASAGLTSIVVTASRQLGWQIPLLVLAVMYCVYRSYQRYFSRIELAPRVKALTSAHSLVCEEIEVNRFQG